MVNFTLENLCEEIVKFVGDPSKAITVTFDNTKSKIIPHNEAVNYGVLFMYIYTKEFAYEIRARESEFISHLTCERIHRNIVPIEYRFRRDDLVNGPLNLETWEKIKELIQNDIFIYPPKINKEYLVDIIDEAMVKTFELLIERLLSVYSLIDHLKEIYMDDKPYDVYKEVVKAVLLNILKDIPEEHHPIFLVCDNSILREVFKELGDNNGNS